MTVHIISVLTEAQNMNIVLPQNLLCIIQSLPGTTPVEGSGNATQEVRTLAPTFLKHQLKATKAHNVQSTKFEQHVLHCKEGESSIQYWTAHFLPILKGCGDLFILCNLSPEPFPIQTPLSKEHGPSEPLPGMRCWHRPTLQATRPHCHIAPYSEPHGPSKKSKSVIRVLPHPKRYISKFSVCFVCFFFANGSRGRSRSLEATKWEFYTHDELKAATLFSKITYARDP